MAEMNGPQQEQTAQRQIESAHRELARMAGTNRKGAGRRNMLSQAQRPANSGTEREGSDQARDRARAY